jgi:NTE family protein
MPISIDFSHRYENLIFEGGGVKGIAYVGAMEILSEMNILPNIKRVGGTSAGAINALLIALGFSISEQQEILSKLDFKKFEDTKFPIPLFEVFNGNFLSRFFRRVWTLVKALCAFKKTRGIHSGKYFETWIGNDIIKRKTTNPDMTFEELRSLGGPELYIVGVDLTTRQVKTFSHEHTPKTPIRKAVRISMSIPIFFMPVEYTMDGSNQTFVDGGLFKNYPIRLFDDDKYRTSGISARSADNTQQIMKNIFQRSSKDLKKDFNLKTLGFRLDSPEDISMLRDQKDPAAAKTDTPMGFFMATLNAIMAVQESQHLESEDWYRTIYIDTFEISTFDFSLSDKNKARLVQSGKDCVTGYFVWLEKELEKERTATLPS